jgi:hypothetical protein
MTDRQIEAEGPPLAAGDARIERFLGEVEQRLGTSLSFWQTGPRPRPIGGERQAFVSEWLDPRAARGEPRRRAVPLTDGRASPEHVIVAIRNSRGTDLPPVDRADVKLQLGPGACADSALWALSWTVFEALDAIWVRCSHGVDREQIYKTTSDRDRYPPQVREALGSDWFDVRKTDIRLGAGAKPVELGWINVLRFEDSARSTRVRESLARAGVAHQEARGASIAFQLTSEPLDLRIAAHCEMLSRAYSAVSSERAP